MNEDGKLDGVYHYIYDSGHYKSDSWGRIGGDMYTCGCSSPEDAAKTRLTLRLSEHDVKKVANGRWKRVAVKRHVEIALAAGCPVRHNHSTFTKDEDDMAVSGEVKMRQDVERKIIRQFAEEMLAQGWELEVSNGEDEKPKTRDIEEVMKSIMETDEDRLYVYRPGEPRPFSWAFFVYGNAGWDVLSDYLTNLDGKMPLTQALIDSYQ